MSKTAQQYSPNEVADKLGISPQAVIKKIQNTLKDKESNCLPDGLTVSKFGRFFVITAKPNFKFPTKKKK